ncbi:MAG: hypothetical protein H8D97_00665 [Proteobacteria bacterium]|nr:hypothetical protein [Pseudomonadota bacterium]
MIPKFIRCYWKKYFTTFDNFLLIVTLLNVCIALFSEFSSPNAANFVSWFCTFLYLIGWKTNQYQHEEYRDINYKLNHKLYQLNDELDCAKLEIKSLTSTINKDFKI